MTVRFRDVVVVVFWSLCGCGEESTATGAPFSFLLSIYMVGPSLQPKDEENVYLSSRRSLDP